jgi:hypothetical protein
MASKREKLVQKKVGVTPKHDLLMQITRRNSGMSDSLIVRKALDRYFGLDRAETGN